MDNSTYDHTHADADYDDLGNDRDHDDHECQGNIGDLRDDETVYEMPADDSAELASAAGDAAATGLPLDCTDQATAVRLFCARWSRMRAQLDPLTAATRGIRLEQAALRRDLAAYMEGARVRRAVVKCSRDNDNTAIVVRVDPTRPTTSMKREVITTAVYEHVTPDLVRACAEAAAAAAEKRSAKVAKAKAVAARKAARAAAAAARPAKRRRRTAKRHANDSDDSGDGGNGGGGHVDKDGAASQEVSASSADIAVTDGACIASDDGDVGGALALADIIGAAVVEATKVAQRRATAQQTTLTVGLYDPDRDDESAMVDAWDASPSSAGTCEPLPCDAEAAQDKPEGSASTLATYAWSTEDVPAEVRAWATRFVELADVASGLRDRMRPIEIAIEALTLDLPPPPETTPAKAPARGGARNGPSARAIEAAAKRERHDAFAPMRDAVARHLSEVGADRRGVPVRFPTSDALYRLRETVRTRTGALTRTDYAPLAAGAAAAAMSQIEVDPAAAYSPDAAADLLEDDEFRNRLFDAVAGGIDQHRERGTVRTRAVSLVRVAASRDPVAPTPDV
ncbi:hypothetical protein psal_cds_852 [Pandoravirus salinus]|uniref:Uncharacterized protein n=1 Tax=Pandoravirus salinus TaxID=1349410 RepID=S4VW88_9VIRU|nr:hypothetical protein psal_cds_852 [Pandoravirus salinus]AGO84909.2 hypothetical protein psal_cds_852 [Pandoravirus salinus]